jgi:hypothetical protein
MSKHLKLHSFTGTSDHDFTGLVSGQIISYNGVNVISSDSVTSFSASTLSGGTILSGGTDLYNIFSTSSGTSIYDADGVLNGSRAVDGDTNDIDFINFANIFMKGDTSMAIESDRDVNITATATTVDGNFNVTNGGIMASGGTDLYDIFATASNLDYVPLTGTSTNVSGDIEFDDDVNLSFNGGSDTIGYDSIGGDFSIDASDQLIINTANGADFATGAILSAGTDLYSIFLTSVDGDATTASNGLTESGNNITLGGVLTGDTSIDIDGNLFALSGGSISMDNSTGLKIGTNIIDAGSGFFGPANYIQMRTDVGYTEPWFFMNADGGTTFGSFIQFALGTQVDDIGVTFAKPSGNVSYANNNHLSLFDNSGLYTVSNTYVRESVVGFFAAEGTATATVKGSVAIASSAVTITDDYTLYTDNLNLIETPDNDDNLTQILARDNSTGTVKYRDTVSLITRVQDGTNISTGGTANEPTINLDADIVLTSVNATEISGGTIYSGATDLYDIFSTSAGVTGSGTNNTIAMWNGTSSLTDSIMTFDGTTGITVAGDVFIQGSVEVLGSATTIVTQDLFVEDNTITLNSGGTAVSATNGGIFVQNGVNNGTDASWTIDAVGNWQTDNGIISSAMTVNNGNLNVTGGGVMQSGGTDLYNIFIQDLQSVMNEGSTSTVGTDVTVARNFTGSSAISRLVLQEAFGDGHALLQVSDGLSASTFQASVNSLTQMSFSQGFSSTQSLAFNGTSMQVNDTAQNQGLTYIGNYHVNYIDRSLVDKEYVDNSILSGNTSDITRVQGGTNISTGGTANEPTINLDADIVLTSVNATEISGGTIYSGATDLSLLFAPITGGGYVNGSGTDNVVPLWNGTNALDDSILSQAGSIMTAAGDMIVTGDFTVNGTTTTIDSVTLQTTDNNIDLNLSGNNTSAIGGGLTVLSGVSNSIDATWLIDTSGNWAANAGIQGTTVTATEFLSMEPYVGPTPLSPSDNDAWFHSGATGSITLNYQVGGTIYAVELSN